MHFDTTIKRQTETRGLTLEAESTVDEVMAVEASLTVVLDSCSTAGLDIIQVPCDLDIGTYTHTDKYFIYFLKLHQKLSHISLFLFQLFLKEK